MTRTLQPHVGDAPSPPQPSRVLIDNSPTTPPAGITIYGCDRGEMDLFRAIAARLGLRPTLTEAPASERTAEMSAGNCCISVGHKSRVSRTTLDALYRAGVRYISTRSIGSNHIDLPAAEQLGLSVEGVAYSPTSVADYTLMLLLMVVREAKATVLCTQAHDYRLPSEPGRELGDMTVGVIGAGRIGSAVVDRLRGFGCQVLVHDIRAEISVDNVPLDALLAASDAVTLHTPLTDETHHLLHRRRIERMKPGAVVVNTGRGSLLDTDALLRALEAGRLGGAALDVLESEEGIFYLDHADTSTLDPLLLRLQALPNVIITPHSAYYTDRALREIAEATLVNCLGFLRESHHG